MKKNQTPQDSDKVYVEFMMQPLREAWRKKGPKRAPTSLNECSALLGYERFEDYQVGRHRQYLLWQLDNVLAKVASQKKDSESLQVSLF